MDGKERLLNLKYGLSFASIQRDLQVKRKQLAEQLGVKNMLHSGYHVREISTLELDSLSSLLDSMLAALLDAYDKHSIPWTEHDQAFLQTKIEDLFKARVKASRQSLIDYLVQRKLDPNIEACPKVT